MKNLFLLIGPSGVGKSKTVSRLKLSDNFVVYKLDDLICKYNYENHISEYFGRIGNQAFFHKSKEAIERASLENFDKIIIIDVGAGSIDFEMCLDYYSQFNTILLIADKEIIYQRIKNRSEKEARTFEEYVESEFKPHKAKLFNSANYKIDTSRLSIEEASIELKNILKKE